MAYELHNFEAGQVLTAEALNAIEAQIKTNEEALANKQDAGEYVTKEEYDALVERIAALEGASAE